MHVESFDILRTLLNLKILPNDKTTAAAPLVVRFFVRFRITGRSASVFQVSYRAMINGMRYLWKEPLFAFRVLFVTMKNDKRYMTLVHVFYFDLTIWKTKKTVCYSLIYDFRFHPMWNEKGKDGIYTDLIDLLIHMFN